MKRILVISAILLAGLTACQPAPEPTPTPFPVFELVLPPAWTATPTISPTPTITPVPAETDTPTPAVTEPPPFEKEYDGLLVTLPSSADPAKTASLWDLVGGFNPLEKPGRRQYAATTAANPGPRLWKLELCASGEDAFAALTASIEVQFLINSLAVDANGVRIDDSGGASGKCRYWTTMVSGWRKDYYQLDVRYTLSAEWTDGVLVRPSGLYAHTVRVTLQK